MNDTRLWRAVILAPLPVPVIYGLQLLPGGSWSWGWFLTIVVMGMLNSYVGMLVLGLPLFRLLQRIGWLSLPTLTFSGGLAGVVIFYLFIKLLTWSSTSTPFDWLQLIWGAAFGVSVALLFCLIAGVPFRRTKAR